MQSSSPKYGACESGIGVIVTQPGAGGVQYNGNEMSNVPTRLPDCPPGLEYLTAVKELIIKQQIETNNKFAIKNMLGQNVFYALENSNCCARNCCGKKRPFNMKFLDDSQNEVMHLYRPLACNSCCFPCCLKSLVVSAPPGNVIGSIEQEWSICTPQYAIKNHHGDVVLRIKRSGNNVEFKIVSLAGNEVGKIVKRWGGLDRELFADSDIFGVDFPLELDVRMKAVVLAAAFLIDAMFFENNGTCCRTRIKTSDTFCCVLKLCVDILGVIAER